MSKELDIAFDRIINCRIIFIFRENLNELELQVNKHILSMKIILIISANSYTIYTASVRRSIQRSRWASP